MAVHLFKALQALRIEKEAARKREAKLVSDIGGVLQRLGYRLEPIGGNDSVRRGPKASGARRMTSPAKPLTCSECGRTFALPLHLGRHMRSMHAAKRGASALPPMPAAADGTAKAAAGTATRRRRRKSTARRTQARPIARSPRKRRGPAPAKRGVRHERSGRVRAARTPRRTAWRRKAKT